MQSSVQEPVQEPVQSSVQEPVQSSVSCDSIQSTYNKERTQYIADLKSKSINPYPHTFPVSRSIKQFITMYQSIPTNTLCQDTVERIAGRVMLIRGGSKKLRFFTVRADGMNLQFMLNFMYCTDNLDKPEDRRLQEFANITGSVCRGDIIGACGFVGRSKTGELTLFVQTMQVLTPCLQDLPKEQTGLRDDEMRVRKRYLDLIVNPLSREPFVIRSRTISFIRQLLDSMDFMEVQTPILSALAGGAMAKPFLTYHNDLNVEMSMRIAPELFLKQLVVGGFERVYEIGQQFRNESIDQSHNPEFMSLELYATYFDYNQLMELCESIMSHTVHSIKGSMILKYQPDDQPAVEIDFTPPYRRIDFVQEIERLAGVELPQNLMSESAQQFLSQLCDKHCIDCPAPRTTPRLLDKLAGHFIEPQTHDKPTFIINHPRVMSPLAKWHRDNPQLTERAELFILGREYANLYTELNDPAMQREAFESQMKDKVSGDDEAMPIDEIYINALEYGLPPTGGLGIGIERTVMLLANVSRIKDVIFFPAMRPAV
jgi:lysyl-tRNA synthetase class 2